MMWSISLWSIVFGVFVIWCGVLSVEYLSSDLEYLSVEYSLSGVEYYIFVRRGDLGFEGYLEDIF